MEQHKQTQQQRRKAKSLLVHRILMAQRKERRARRACWTVISLVHGQLKQTPLNRPQGGKPLTYAQRKEQAA